MNNEHTRRTFIKNTSAAVAASTVLTTGLKPAQAYHHSVDETLKVGLVGCGGRGTSAVGNALKADENVMVTALADAFRDRLDSCAESLERLHGEKYQVDEDHKFVGFDCHEKIMETDIDVVLLCSPPHFRPAQMEAAVAARKQIFCEKPIATDAPGVRRVMDACNDAEFAGLNVVSGLCWRYDLGVNEVMDKIQAGGIGEIQSIHSNYLAGELWHHTRKDEWSEMEYQCRNWLYFNWLSGDLITEQHIHTIDKGLWLMGDEAPEFCYGLGGRQKRIGEQWGNVFDHMTTVFEWANGVKMVSMCRQMNECFSENECYVTGTTGTAQMLRNIVINEDGEWRRRGRKPSMYDVEHQHLFEAIRGERDTINNGEYMCKSTLAALMGRQANYTGQKIVFSEYWNDEQTLGPDEYDWNDNVPNDIAVPGMGPS